MDEIKVEVKPGQEAVLDEKKEVEVIITPEVVDQVITVSAEQLKREIASLDTTMDNHLAQMEALNAVRNSKLTILEQMVSKGIQVSDMPGAIDIVKP